MKEKGMNGKADFKIKRVFLILLILFFSTKIVLAASFLVPDNTKVIREETIESAGEAQQIAFCESKLSEEEISSFYRKKLEERGYSIFLNQKNLSIYLKGEEMFMIMVAPSGETGKTSLVLTTGKMGVGRGPTGPRICEDVPNVPVYPGAQCMSSMRMKNGSAISVRYSASAELGDVIGFYRSQMLNKGWTLEEETPVAQHLYRNMPDENILDGLDLEGASQLEGMLGDLNLEGATLFVFKSLKDEHCMISLGPAPMQESTLINITYEKEK
jgi:hypothetical protein